METTLSMKRYFQDANDKSVYSTEDVYKSMMWSGQVISFSDQLNSENHFIGSSNIFTATQKYSGIMAYHDTITFLEGIFNVYGATELKDIIINLGNETNGSAYSTGVITGYMLMAVNDFRESHPEFHFKVSAQAFSEDQNLRVDAGTFVQGLQYSLDYISKNNNKISSASMDDLVKNIDQLVVHPLENSETAYNLDVPYYKYYYSTVNELRKAAPGVDFNPELNASAWSGEYYNAASGGISDEERLVAAENVLASFVSMLQMGADAASYFGLDYYKHSSYTLSWEGIRYANFYLFKWLAELTPGKFLISLGDGIDTYDARSDSHAIATFMDAKETVLFYIVKGETSELSINLGSEYGNDPEITYDVISKGTYKAYDTDPTSNTQVDLDADGAFKISGLSEHSIVRVTIHTAALSRELPDDDGNPLLVDEHVKLGGAGNDLLFGHTGDDFMDGREGNDSLHMDSGNDTLDGGAHNDWLIITGTTGATVDLTRTSAQNTGYGFDVIRNIENISGGSGFDKLYGTNGSNVLQGNNGNDSLYGGGGNDRLVGGNGDDLLVGQLGNDTLFGGSGNDRLMGQQGDDSVYGAEGNDSLYMDYGNDTLDGGWHNDWLIIDGTANSNVALTRTTAQNTGYGFDVIRNIENISGGSGSDKLYGTNGSNVLQGNNGNDSLYGGGGNDRLVGGNGDDLLVGQLGNDTLFGGSGHNRLMGQQGDDSVYGAEGNDSLYMDYGNDTLDGGWHNDWLIIDGTANSNVALTRTTAQNTGYGFDVIRNIENISGGSGSDKLYGTNGSNVLQGNSGNDSLYGGGGNDRLVGGNGDDLLVGQLGNDTLFGGSGHNRLMGQQGDDSVYGAEGNDSLYMDYGNDTLDGGWHNDWLIIDGTANSNVALTRTTAQNTGYGFDVIRNIENISGGSGSDKLYGTNGSNVLQGNSGNDSLYGGGGNDHLAGGNGDDLLVGQLGNDTLFGGSGNDRLMGQQGDDSVYGAEGNDSLYMDYGNDTLDGGWHNDWLIIDGTANSNVDLTRTTAQNTGYGFDVIRNIENIAGGSGADKLRGTSGDNHLQGRNGNDLIYGHGGDDTLSGGNGNDVLYGQSGNDIIYGGAGNDTIYGGIGNDRFYGGAGKDHFVFRDINDTNISDDQADIIFDFQEGFDKIDMRSIYNRFDDANSSFHFKGMHYSMQDSRGGIIYKNYDLAGTKDDYTMIYINAEMGIKLMDLHNLSASDFIF
ncbi:calcium-binding protein [Albirhodobacter sp. R86504]|uniref:calcium-binding protein n=1 Tax=Albirhodobacter sp. R86504 TaxID=3093848 RepID=UPI00366E1D4B